MSDTFKSNRCLGTLGVFAACVCATHTACKREPPSPAPAAPPGSVLAILDTEIVPVADMDAATLKAWADAGGMFWRFKGCYACHTLDGTKLVGRSAQGLWGTKLKQSDGRELLVDEAFVRESISQPASTITAGYANQMPVQSASEREVVALVALYRSLGPDQPTPIEGAPR